MDLESDEGAADQISLPLVSGYPSILHEAPKLKLMAGAAGTGNGLGESSNGIAAGGEGHELRVVPTDVLTVRKPSKYRECLKNYAASLGGHATDGCGEFMPSGEDGTLEALKCAACGCHRNFHRREAEDERASCSDCGHQLTRRDSSKRFGPLLPLTPHAPPLALPPTSLIPCPPPSQMIMALSVGRCESDDQQDIAFHSSPPPSSASLRKRFRTKFTVEQKEKMLELAEKLGWRIQKQDEQMIQQFCSEAGVKRHVLKIWMHNNKHTLGKKPL